MLCIIQRIKESFSIELIYRGFERGVPNYNRKRRKEESGVNNPVEIRCQQQRVFHLIKRNNQKGKRVNAPELAPAISWNFFTYNFLKRLFFRTKVNQVVPLITEPLSPLFQAGCVHIE